MDPWTQLLMDAHESHMSIEEGEHVDPEYVAWNTQARDDHSLTDEQRFDLIYKMTEVLVNEILETMPKTKELAHDLLKELQEGSHA